MVGKIRGLGRKVVGDIVGNIRGRGCKVVGALSAKLGVGGVRLLRNCRQHQG